MHYATHQLPQHHDRLQGCLMGRVLGPLVDLSSSFIEVMNHKKGVMSWDALWVDLVCSDDCYCPLIPPLFQSDPVCLLNGYSFYPTSMISCTLASCRIALVTYPCT